MNFFFKLTLTLSSSLSPLSPLPPTVRTHTHTCTRTQGLREADRATTALTYLTAPPDAVPADRVYKGSRAAKPATPSRHGGETVFPRLGVTVHPTVGKALVFSGTSDEGWCDPLAIHESVPVQGDAWRKLIVQKWCVCSVRTVFCSLHVVLTVPLLPSMLLHIHTHTTCRYVPKAVSDEEQERVHEMRALGHVDDGRAFVLCDASNSCREYWTLAKAWRKKREAGEASGRDEL